MLAAGMTKPLSSFENRGFADRDHRGLDYGKRTIGNDVGRIMGFISCIPCPAHQRTLSFCREKDKPVSQLLTYVKKRAIS
jgi:hypothetical protein